MGIQTSWCDGPIVPAAAEPARWRPHQRRLSVRVGELGGVNPELLRAAYELARVGTVCAGAPLDIAAVPARWACDACGRTVPGDGPRRCHACGAPARLVAGDDLVLEQIELEVPDV